MLVRNTKITGNRHQPAHTFRSSMLPGALGCYSRTCCCTFKLQSQRFYDLPLFKKLLAPLFPLPLLVLCLCFIGYTTFKHTAIPLRVWGWREECRGSTNRKIALSVVARTTVSVETTFFYQHLKIIFRCGKNYHTDRVQEGGGYVKAYFYTGKNELFYSYEFST